MTGTELGQLLDKHDWDNIPPWVLSAVATEIERLTVARIESAVQVAERAGVLMGLTLAFEQIDNHRSNSGALRDVEALIAEKRKEWGE